MAQHMSKTNKLHRNCIKCAFPRCHNPGKDVQLYGSPKRSKERYLKWAEFAERKSGGFFYICQYHFERNCFSFLGPVPRLLPRSVPTLKTASQYVGTAAKENVSAMCLNAASTTGCFSKTVKSKPVQSDFPETTELHNKGELRSRNPNSQPQLSLTSDQVSALRKILMVLQGVAQGNFPRKACEEECDRFGKLVACYLKLLPADVAHSCQKYIHSYVVKHLLSHIRNSVGPDLKNELNARYSTTLPAPSFTSF